MVEVPQRFRRRPMGSGFRWLARMVLGLRVTDFTCGFKAFTSEAALRLFSAQRETRRSVRCRLRGSLWPRCSGFAVTTEEGSMISREALKREAPPLALLAVLSVVVLWPQCLGGRVLLPADLLLVMEPWRHHSRQFPEFTRVGNPMLDAIQQTFPWRAFEGESLRDGVIPLWNPHALSGNPFVANNQSAVFYPEAWLLGIMSTQRALGWGAALCFFTAGSLMYWFLRVLRLGRGAALVGGIAFMFNGFIVGWICLPGFRCSAAWLPGILAAFELYARRRGAHWSALCALMVGMQLLAGNLQVTLIVLCVFACYVLVRLVALWLAGERRGMLTVAGGAVASVVGGFLVGSIQLLPSVELGLMSARIGGTPYAEHLKHAIPGPYLLASLMPDLFGSPVDNNHWGAELGKAYRAYTETTWYVGVAPVLLLPAALFLGRSRQRWFWLAVLVGGMALAFGTPLYWLAYHGLPGMSAFTGIGRWIMPAGMALAVLGAMGVQSLLQARDVEASRPGVKLTAIATGALLLAGLLGGAWVWVNTGGLEEVLPGIGGYTAMQVLRFGVLAVVVGAACCGLRRRPNAERPARLLLLRDGSMVLASLMAGVSLWSLTDGSLTTTTGVFYVGATLNLAILAAVAGGAACGLRARPKVATVALLLVLALDLGIHVRKFAPATDPRYLSVRTQTIDIIRGDSEHPRMLSLGENGIQRMAPNTPMAYGLEDIQCSDSLEVGAGRRLLRAIESDRLGFPQPDPGHPVVDMLGVKYIHSSVPLEGIPGLRPVLSSEGWLYRNTEALPRAYTVAAVRSVPDDAAALAAVSSRDFDPRETVVLVGAAREPGPELAREVRLTRHDTNVVTVQSDFEPPQTVVLADTYFPGWRAYINGSEVPVRRANYAVRAVELTQPAGRIDFVYEPASFRVGAFVTLCAVAALAGVAAVRLTRRREHDHV